MSFNPHELTLIESQVECQEDIIFNVLATPVEIESEITEAESTWLEALFADEEEKKHDMVMNDASIDAMNNIINR